MCLNRRTVSHNIGVNIGITSVAVMPRPKLWSASAVETEDHDMSLIRNRRGFLSAMFSALLALALFDGGEAAVQEAKQIKLTEKHIQGAMAAYQDMAKLYEGASSDQPDPKLEARAAAVAKKNGFVDVAEYDDVWMNISAIMSGIDPQSKKFTEPREQIKKEIAALKANKSIPDEDKKEDLSQLEEELKNTKPIQFKENIALVLKYFDKLAPLMQENSNLRPAD
jgi:hypothetical protein